MAEEKQQSRQASLTLQVMNGNELESGRAAKCLFSENGGDIGHTPVKRRTKNAKAFHDKCENFSFRASNETDVLITAFYSLHGDHLGYG